MFTISSVQQMIVRVVGLLGTDHTPHMDCVAERYL
jgi:hypothetical protein